MNDQPMMYALKVAYYNMVPFANHFTIDICMLWNSALFILWEYLQLSIFSKMLSFSKFTYHNKKEKEK